MIRNDILDYLAVAIVSGTLVVVVYGLLLVAYLVPIPFIGMGGFFALVWAINQLTKRW